jgi:hypothetical protein
MNLGNNGQAAKFYMQMEEIGPAESEIEESHDGLQLTRAREDFFGICHCEFAKS